MCVCMCMCVCRGRGGREHIQGDGACEAPRTMPAADPRFDVGSAGSLSATASTCVFMDPREAVISADRVCSACII